MGQYHSILRRVPKSKISGRAIDAQESEAAPLAKHRLVAARPPPPLVWIDVETTGLVAEKDIILEVAMLVTDGELNELSPAQSLVIGYPPDTVQSKLNAWSLKSHTKSGLLGDVAQSQLTLEMAEKILLAGVVEHCPKANRAILAGNNVGFDRKFIEQHMPVLAGHLHFRNLDVSSVNELAKRWAPVNVLAAHKKTFSHRAIDDIRESLRELRHYRSTFFVTKIK